jgi:hypothetical protein
LISVFSIAENLKAKQIVTSRKSSSRNMTRSEHTQFAYTASQIGKDIAAIYDKLQGLTKRKFEEQKNELLFQ